MTLAPTTLVHRLIAGRPWRVPTDHLVALVEIEIEPTSILQIGHDLHTTRLLRDTFPEAAVTVREPEHVGQERHDLVVCAFGLSNGYPDDRALAVGLVERVAPRGVLAVLELVGSSSTEVDGLLVRHGVQPRGTLVRELGASMRTLHREDGRTWMGLWRHVVFVGRRR